MPHGVQPVFFKQEPLRLLLFEKGCGSPQRTRFARTFARLFSHL